jgi:hypothetical protein
LAQPRVPPSLYAKFFSQNVVIGFVLLFGMIVAA